MIRRLFSSVSKLYPTDAPAASLGKNTCGKSKPFEEWYVIN